MPPKLPSLKPKKVISALKRAGFKEVRSKGSHIHFKKENLLVTVPFHNRDLKKGTLKSILQQAKLTEEQFLKYL